MSTRKVRWLSAFTLVLLLSARGASAQFAVIDVASIAQLLVQYETLQQQLTTARDHLEQARQDYAAVTGGRGMEHLLSGITRNYLPGDWQTLVDALHGQSTDFAAFAHQARAFLETNAVLTPEQLAQYSAEDQKHIDDLRHTTATLQALSQQALGANSERFNGLQELIEAIAGADDPKAILDLQARIQAEQAMLANDANKLHALFESVQAEQGAQRLRRREQAIADIGSFADLPPLGL